MTAKYEYNVYRDFRTPGILYVDRRDVKHDPAGCEYVDHFGTTCEVYETVEVPESDLDANPDWDDTYYLDISPDLPWFVTLLDFLSYLEAVLVSGSDLDREYWFPNLERARYYADPSNSENPHQTRAAEAAVDYYSNGD